tara:strand:+ start:1023 stop:1634 length:612 start_codon:yes stop_codon:yes gene_type:complete
MLRKSFRKFFLKRFEYSEAGQDIFALNLIGKNGTYLEVGGFKPKLDSNTYILETQNNWRGITIEFKKELQSLWSSCKERENRIYFEDALKFDYKTALEENNLPLHLNYLSCDIDPRDKTFEALKKILKEGLSFDFISFEHDDYTSNESYHKLASEYLIPKGYKIAVNNIYPKNKKNKIFETWFVNSKINFEPIEFSEWKDNNL